MRKVIPFTIIIILFLGFLIFLKARKAYATHICGTCPAGETCDPNGNECAGAPGCLYRCCEDHGCCPAGSDCDDSGDETPPPPPPATTCTAPPPSGDNTCTIRGKAWVKGVDERGIAIDPYGIENLGLLWVKKPLDPLDVRDNYTYKSVKSGGDYTVEMGGVTCGEPLFFLVTCENKVLETISVENIPSGGSAKVDFQYDLSFDIPRNGDCGDNSNVCVRPVPDENDTCVDRVDNPKYNVRYPFGPPSFKESVGFLEFCAGNLVGCLSTIVGSAKYALGSTLALSTTEATADTFARTQAIQAGFGPIPKDALPDCNEIYNMNQLSSGINRGRSGFTIRGATRPEKEKEICKAAQDSHPTYPVCKEGTVTKTFSDFVLPGDPPEPGKLDDEYFPHYLCVLDDNDGIANADSEPWLSNTNYACSGFNCTPDPASSTYNPALTRTPVSLKGSEFSIRGAENVSSLLASLYTRPGKNIYERKTDRCEEASSQIRISRTRNLIIECTKEAKGGAAFNLYVTGEQLINAFQNALSVCIPGAGYNESACNAIKANSEENATLYFKLPYVDLVNKSFANYTDSIIRPGKCTPETGAVGTLSGKGVISGEFKKAPYVSDGFGTPVTGKDIIYQTFDRPREPL